MLPLQPADPPSMGPYTLAARIGAGGMGRVYLGRSPGGRPVAVKVIRHELAGEPGFRARFRREVAAARRVSGAYTAPVLDADPEAATPWMATAYIAGPSLQQAVETHGPLGERPVRMLGAALAEAIASIHALGQIHRDLKPANILLAADGPRVIDFGIARVLDDTALSMTGLVIGTAGYQSPEQAEGGLVGPAADVFALGAVLAFAATGRHPFGTGPAHVLMYRAAHESPDLAGIPGDLAVVIAACLMKAATGRPGARDVIAMLRPPAVTGETAWLPTPVVRDIADREATLVRTLAVTRALPAHRRAPLGRRRLLIGGGAAALIAAASGGGVLWSAGRGRASGKDAGTGAKGGTGAHGVHAAAKLTPPRLVWTGPGSGALRTPVVAGESLICIDRTAGKSIRAIDVGTGKTRWTSPFTARPPLWGDAAAVTDGSSVYGVGNGRVYAADAGSGKVQWTWRGDGLVPQFVVGRMLVCIDATGQGVGLDTVTRQPVWRRRLYDVRSGATLSGAAVSRELNLFFLGDSNGIVQASDVATGIDRWSLVGGGFGGPLFLAGELLYVLGRPDSGLTALDARTGTTKWTPTPVPKAYSVGVSGGTLFVGGDGLTAFVPATGVRQWTRTGQADGVSPDNGIATAAGGVLAYVSSRRLEGADPATGKVVWTLPVPTLTGLNDFAVSSGNRLFVGNERAVLGLQFPA